MRRRRASEGLPEYLILELRFLDVLSIKEAAREMGISVANAEVLQHRALRMAANSCPAEPGSSD